MPPSEVSSETLERESTGTIYTKAPEAFIFRGLALVAGARFELATFGL